MKRLVLITVLAALSLTACESNPLLTDPRTLEYTAELADLGHAHTLSDVGFTVTIKNGLGHMVTDFESVALERRQGTGTWRAIALSLQGQSWTGSYNFASSGPYELRVMATRHGVTEPIHIPFHDHAMGEMEVGRAHVNIDGVRFEFENFPGHVHEGDQAIARFWVMQADRDANGVRQPISGFQGTIACSDADGSVEQHAPTETEPGVYEAVHTWTEGGAARAVFRFGNGQEASFHFNVAHKH